VEVYGRYHMRNEPLDTLDRIQEAYFDAGRDELRRLADTYLVPQKMQVFVVGDKSIEIKQPDGRTVTLGEDLAGTAASLGLPYRELELR